MAPVVIVVIFALAVFVICFLFQKKNGGLQLPPGPPGLPIIGNIHQFDASNPTLYLYKLSKQYGPIVSLRLGYRLAVAISSARVAKEALKARDLQFAGRPKLRATRTLSYNDLGVNFTTHNNEWRERRKRFVTNLFNTRRVDDFRHARNDEILRMTERISSEIGGGGEAVIKLSEVTKGFLRNITFRVAFSRRFEEDDDEAQNRFDAFLTEVQAMVGTTFFSDCFPSFIGGWLDELTGMNRRLRKSFKESDEFYQQIVDEHLDPKRAQVLHQARDAIDDLLSEMENEPASHLTLDHIKANILEIIAAADASKVTLEWCMTYLMKNPKALKKSQDEIRNAVKDKGFVDEDDLRVLPYLKAVVKETLRIQPPAQLIPRETTERCIIDGYEVPAKSMVFVNLWAIGRDAEVWDQPEEFMPERFIGSSIDLKGHHFEFIPFGAGRRICPGIPLAMPSVELALANLLYKFDWKMPFGLKISDLDFEVSPGVTQQKKNPLTMVATKFI